MSARVFSPLAGTISRPTRTPTPTPIHRTPTLPNIRDSSLCEGRWWRGPGDRTRFRTSSWFCLDIVHIVRQAVAHGMKQLEPCIEEDAKKWFSPPESHVCLPTIVSPIWRCRNRVGCWRRDCTQSAWCCFDADEARIHHFRHSYNESGV